MYATDYPDGRVLNKYTLGTVTIDSSRYYFNITSKRLAYSAFCLCIHTHTILVVIGMHY